MNVRAYSVHPGLVNTDLFNNTYFSKLKFTFGFKVTNIPYYMKLSL